MPFTSKVFFVFNQREATRLVENPALLQGVDSVISVLPGVSLKDLSDVSEYLTLEQSLEVFGITQLDISTTECDYALALLDRDSIKPGLLHLGAGESDSVRLALLNHVGLLMHNALSFELLFRALIKNGLRSALCFQFHGRYRLTERLDIRFLLRAELGFGPQLAHNCAQSNVPLVRVGSGDRFGPIKNALRNILLRGYKAKTLFLRSLVTKKQLEAQTFDAAFIVRARTEVLAAEPILRMRAKFGFRDIMLVDDLIKLPDGSAAASTSPYSWSPLHAYSSPKDVVRISLRCLMKSEVAARCSILKKPERIASWGFFGQAEVAQQVLYTAFATVPELLIHRLQLERAFEQMKQSVVVSFDTVDRWGALQGGVARSSGLRSVMVQNSSVDDVVYPWPQAMDDLVVSNERVRDIMIKSGAKPGRVHAFGLPLQDDVIISGDIRLNNLRERAARSNESLRIMIATQPFVQEFDYNTALIEDLVAATKRLSFTIEWILKPHPREEAEKYHKLLDHLTSQSLNIRLFSGSLEDALEHADILLSRTSTSLEFAALGGLPGVAHLNGYPREILKRLDYLSDPVTYKTFSVTDICSVLERFAPDIRYEAIEDYAKRRALFLSKFFPGKGSAAQRVTQLIETGLSSC